jgi:hypothetical protein
MGGMQPPFFKELHQALKSSADLTQIQQVWQESQALLAAIRSLLPQGLHRQAIRARRSDPARGIRGSELTVIALNAASAAKVRLALADRIPDLQSQGWGIQSLRVIAPREQSIASIPAVVAPRAPIPAGVRQQFVTLSESIQSEPLKRALKRIGR